MATAMVTPELRSNALTRNDLIEASKVIHDLVFKHCKSLIKDVETSMTMSVGAVLENRFDKKLGVEFDKKMDNEFEKRLEVELHKRMGVLENHYGKQLAVLETSYNKRLELLEKSYDEKMLFMQKSHLGMLERFSDAIRSLSPVVNVSVPEQERPIVQVNLPEMSVHVPESVINVTTPEVQVNVPPPRMVEKTFEYDQSGRPLKVTETEKKE